MLTIVEDFKIRFNKALTLRHMRPVELKEKTGISESAISQYRSGYSKPKQDKLYLLATALDVSPTWLMGLDVPMEVDKPPEGYHEYLQQLYDEHKDKQKEKEEIEELIKLLLLIPRSERLFLLDWLKSHERQP